MKNIRTIAVLGAGAWGTALAMQLARQENRTVRLWDHDPEHVKSIARTRCNASCLPEQYKLPDTISVYSNLEETLSGVADVVIVVPSHAFCEVLEKIKPYITRESRIIWGTKGFPARQGQNMLAAVKEGHVTFLHDIVRDVFKGAVSAAVLSGPSFAVEVAEGLPTAVTIASDDASATAHWVALFHSDKFRVYASDDIVGVEIGGILKNVIAVAVGAAAGFGLGDNTRSALITRGLAEMRRLGNVLGANPETLIGLSGLGDLILTSTSDKSRNYRFGFALGSGLSLAQAKKAAGNVIESIHNVEIVCALAKAKRVDVPIIMQAKYVICNGLPVADAIAYLLGREPAREF